MNRDDYQKVKEIFNSVLEIEPEGRAAFLDEKCDGENGLRVEVERLLESYDSEFLKVPAAGDLTNGDSNRSTRSSQQIGHYTILEKIGSGGMGDVYLAEDGKLRRRVAIKFLSESLTNDPDRLHRFEQEAQTASALNHPNILTVYEIGETDDIHYIATEYIDGETLRSKLNRGKLTVGEALDVAIQCASALAAAHENGIIHRDIKPENIMLRRDNLVKVLDFGLAKLVEKKNVTVSHDALTEKHVKTAPGVIMGTVQYMSPEQTRGHATDARTDIWSFGCVLYEMIAGNPPFAGDNTADLIVEIVKSYPIPVSQTADDIPERLDEIVGKAMEKTPEERYQTAKDLLLDLKRLKRKLDLETEVERSHSSAMSNGGPSTDSTDEAQTSFIPNNTEESTKNTVSSAEYIVSGIQKHRKATAFATVAILLLVGGAVIAAWYSGIIFAPESQGHLFESYEMTRFTTSGKSNTPAISRDGRLVAFVTSEGPLHSLRVRQIATGSEVVLLSPKKLDYFWGVRFSPDNDYVYFTIVEEGYGNLYRVPALGGMPKKLIADVDSNVSFSPNGSRFAFIRHSFEKQTSAIVIANSDGSDPQPLIATDGFGSLNEVAWSPVEDTLLVSVRHDLSESYSFGGTRWTLGTISTASRDLKLLGTRAWHGARDLNWVQDGSGFVFSARNEKTDPLSIWMVSYPSAVPRQLTNDPDSYPMISAVSNDNTIAIARATNAAALWSLNLKNSEVKQILSESPDQAGGGFQELADGRFLVSRIESAWSNLWILDSNWKTETKLTDERSANGGQLVTPDGQHIIFLSNRTGRFRIWRMNIDGSNPVQLTDSATGDDGLFTLLPDGKTIVFVRSVPMSLKSDLLKTTIDGGEPEVVYSDENTNHSCPSVSLDGKYLAHWLVSHDQSTLRSTSVLIISEIRGDQVIPTGRQLSMSEIGMPMGPCVWVDEQNLICSGSNDGSNLYLVSLTGQPAKKLTDFNEKMIDPHTLSRDRSRLYFSRHVSNTDIYLMKDKSE